MEIISYIRNKKLMEEIWKDIEGFEGLYQVSNLGRVKTLERYVRHPLGGLRLKKEKVLKPFAKQGYLYIDFGRKKQYRMHRLVASAFIPNPQNKPEVNHIDFNKHNNNLSNLEWVTRSENSKHTVANNRWNNQYTIGR